MELFPRRKRRPLPVPAALQGSDDVIIRESVRARRLLLRVHESAQVEIVVPRGTPLPLVDAFVCSHLDWIAQRVARARSVARPAEAFPPLRIDLASLGEQWDVVAKPDEGGWRLRESGEGQLQLRGSGTDAACRAALRRWLVLRGQQVLVPWLAELAQEHGFRHGAVSLRLQRTRWGSCSSRGAISLNLALLFQPPPVLRYVLLHELAHTRHHDHSRAFWALVASCEPDYRRLDVQLRTQGWRNVPDWLRPGRGVRA